MGLNNVKDIKLRFFKVTHNSAESSYKFLRGHPRFSCVSLICTILYIFLSHIYTFLAYMSPFLICGAIFLRIFWSSEQTQLRYVKREEEKVQEKKVEKKKIEVEPICPKLPPINNGRRDFLFKYPSQNATSRRRNFRDKKWDVYGGLEEKAKDLSAVFQNEFITRNMVSFDKGDSSLYYGLSGRKFQVPKRQTLRSEPSMVDLVECDIGMDIEKMETREDEDDEDTQDERNKGIEWTENDQKNLMDLGLSEMERNKRLESLMSLRKQRKLLNSQLEKGVTDNKTLTPGLMAPLHITRVNGNNIDDLEMPGSAPSVMPRSPYDIPYEPFEEKPNLSGDSFYQEYIGHLKDMSLSRHESFNSFSSEQQHDHGGREPFSFHGRKYSDRFTYSRFRKIPDEGNRDRLIDQLICNEGGENSSLEPNPQSKEEESTHEEDGNSKIDIADMNVEEVETSQETKSFSNKTSESGLIPNITNVDIGSEKEGLETRFSKPHDRFLNNTTTNINESMYESVPSPIDKRQETMFLSDRRLYHTPTYSIASDLQVEVSEVGSPPSTVDENDDSNSSFDRDSAFYDGDIDRDVSSGSEDLWGASFHGPRGVRNEENIVEDGNNNSKDIASPISLREIDEENAADVSSYSSRSDRPEDTPTCCAITSDQNIFGYMKYSARETETPQSSNSFVEPTPDETHSEKQQERGNPSENLTNESEVVNDVNNSIAREQDNLENSTSNEEPGPSTSLVSLESIDETSVNSISSSPRSVLPDQITVDDVSPSAFNQQMDIDAQQSNVEDIAPETLNGEHPPDTMLLVIQPLMGDVNGESHRVFNHSQQSNMDDATHEILNGEHSPDTMPQNIQPLIDDPNHESHSVFNNSQQSNMEEMTQETLNGEHPLDTLPQNTQPLMDDVTNEAHSVEFNYSQEHINSQENLIEESNNFGSTRDGKIYIKEQDKKNNEEKNEDNSTYQISQEDTLESTRQMNDMTTMEDADEKSRDLVDDKVLFVEENNSNEILENGNHNIQEDFLQPRATEPMVPGKEENEGHAQDS